MAMRFPGGVQPGPNDPKDYVVAGDLPDPFAHLRKPVSHSFWEAPEIQAQIKAARAGTYKGPAVPGLPPEAFSPVASDVILRDKVPADISARMRAYQVTPDEVVAGGFTPPPAPLDILTPTPAPTRSIGDAPMAPPGALPDLPDVATIANGFFHQGEQFGLTPKTANVPSSRQGDQSFAPYQFPSYGAGQSESAVLPSVMDDFFKLTSHAS